MIDCPVCGCPCQRSSGGTLAEGLAAHLTVVHRMTDAAALAEVTVARRRVTS